MFKNHIARTEELDKIFWLKIPRLQRVPRWPPTSGARLSLRNRSPIPNHSQATLPDGRYAC